MALIVEDGTGLSTAESYTSVVAFKAYADAHGHAYAGKSDTQIEQALRRATQWIDATYSVRFNGNRINATQALMWPMSGLIDRGGYAIASDAVPRQIVSATAEAGARELATPQSLSPDVVPGEVVKREKFDKIEFEYAIGSGGASVMAPELMVIDGILAPLFPMTKSRYSGTAVRG
jgi:hypothetical protein